MKKNLIYFFAAMALMLGFASCNKDNDNDEPQQPREYACNELEFVIGQLCALDENNEPVEYYIYRRNPVLAPTELYMIAENREEAKAIFRQWIPVFACDQMTKNGTEVQLFDTMGHLQSTLTLSFSDKPEEVGVLDFSPNPYSKVVSKVHFIPSAAWGENASGNPYNILLDGQGTAKDPFLIHDYNEFKVFLHAWAGPGAQDHLNARAALYYKLDGDIDCNGDAILIPTFQGVFDGAGHAIRNYQVKTFQKTVSNVPCDMAGLFMDINCAIVKNLNLYPNPVQLPSSVKYFGQITPWVNFAMLENVNVYGAEVAGEAYNDGLIAGGLVGVISKSRSTTKIYYNYGSEFMKNYYQSDAPARIIGCKTDVDFQLSVGGDAMPLNLGGLVGRDEKSIRTLGEFTGGFPIRNCTVDGPITVYYDGESIDSKCIGGLVGYLFVPIGKDKNEYANYGSKYTNEVKIIKK